MTYFTTGVQLQAALNALPGTKTGKFVAFDSSFYSQQYMGAYQGTLSALEHFVQIGASLGFKPNATFDPVYYKNAYADLKNTDFNAADLLYHFMQYGLDEGRTPNAELATFSGAAYLVANPDVADYVNANLAQFNGSATNGALAHYVKFGAVEGRDAPGAGGKALVYASAASVDEGDTVTFTIAVGQPNFTYTYDLTGVVAADVVGGALTGTVTTDANGNGTFTVALANDRVTDGVDTLVATLPNTGLSASVSVNDTSLNNIAPVAVDATGATTEAGAVVAGQLVATDAENDAVTFALDAAVEGLTLNADGTYSFDPALNTAAQALTYKSDALQVVANYTVTDALGATDAGTLTITVTPKPLTFAITADKTSAEEGATTVYTVKASESLAEAVDVVFTLQPGDGLAVNAGTANTNTADFATGAFNPTTVTIAAGADTATFNVVAVNDATTELQESYSVKAEIAGQAAMTLSSKVVDATGAGGVGQTFTLTTGVDQGANFTGTTGNDTFIADYSVTDGVHTLGGLDVLNGGAGVDTLQITDQHAGTFTFASSATLSGIETVTVRAAQAAVVNVSGSTITGLESVAVTQATNATVTAGLTTDVDVSGASGSIVVDGGKNTVVTDATAAQNITIGGTTVGAGTVTVTDSNQTTGAIAIDGGTDVTVTASKATTGTVKIGDTTAGAVAADMPSGAVTLTTTGAAYAAADADATRGAITIVGGSSVTVNQTATSDSSAAATDTDTTGQEVTQSAITVNGNSATTAVTINQSAAVAAVDGVAAVAGAYDTQKVTFVALAAGETTVVNGLTFTASKALTAAEVAAAFANVANGATHGSAAAGNGIYSGTFNTVAGATGAVTTASGVSTVTFTSATMDNAVALTVNDTAAAGNVSVATVADGSAATNAVTGVMGVVGGQVIVDGTITGTDVLTSVSLNGYGASSQVESDALTSLTLANSKAADLDVVNGAATTLALTLNKIGTGSDIDLGSTYTTLNVTTTGANSDVTLVAGGVQTLTVAGDKSVDLTGATLSALKTVTVSGSAGLTIDASGATVTAVNTAATTGTVTATVDASKATYTGGAGVDNVTLSSPTVSKAVNTGAGDDKVTLASGTTSLTEAIVAGEGTDTLVMAAADAATASAANVFETKIDGFEKLSLGAAGAAQTVNLANLDDISYVISAGGSVLASTKEQQTIVIGASGGTPAATDDISVTIAGVTVTVSDTDVTDKHPVADLLARAINATVALQSIVSAATNHVDTVTLTYLTDGDKTAATFNGDVDAAAGTLAATVNDNVVAYVPAGALTLDKMANNGTLELTAVATTTTVTMADATSTTADVFNIVTKVDGSDLNFGTVAVAGVETVNITATDTTPVNTTTGAATISKATLTVSDTAVKSIVVTGNSDLDLTAAGASLTSVNASALTGKLTFSSAVNSAVITGGSAADTLTGSGNSQTLNGGAGADNLIVTGDLAVLTGGAGNDVFNIGGNATTNVNSYATITDLAAGDVIKFSAAAADFMSAKVTLGDTAVFQDLANAAIANSDGGDVAWFQFSGNTYVIENVSDNASAFVNNTDIIVKITGLVDLSTASFSSSDDTLLIA